MKNFIKKQNIVALLLMLGSATTIINASQKSEDCNANSTETNIEKEFDKLIACALLNPTGSRFRKGGQECGKYFLPLSNYKAIFRIVEATDFSEEGQRIASEFVKKHKNTMGQTQICDYIQKKHPKHYYSEIEILELALQDQIPGKKYNLYKNPFLMYAVYCQEKNHSINYDDLFGAGYWQLPIITNKQDQKNIIETITRHKRQIQDKS